MVMAEIECRISTMEETACCQRYSISEQGEVKVSKGINLYVSCILAGKNNLTKSIVM